MKGYGQSLEWWWGVVFALWMTYQVIAGVSECSGDYAVCPGQAAEVNLWTSLGDWRDWDDAADLEAREAVTEWRSALPRGVPDTVLAGLIK